MAVGVVAADQASKAWANASLEVGHEVTVVPGWVWVRLAHNTGATLGLFTGRSDLIAIISLVVLAAVALLAFRYPPGGLPGALMLGGLLGGGVSNVIDRVRFGAVTDFVEVHLWPTDFNLADAAIRLGVVLFLLSLVLQAVRRPARVAS